MKRNLLFIVVILWSAGHLFAQGGEGYQQQTSEERAQDFVKRLHDRIPFRNTQRDSLESIFKTFFDEMQLYKSDGNVEVIKILTQKRDTAVKQVLADDDKYVVYLKYLEELKAAREKRQKEYGGQRGMHEGRHRGQ